jgi:hypothetical protein
MEAVAVVEEIITVAVLVPPAMSGGAAGLIKQVGWKAAELVETTQPIVMFVAEEPLSEVKVSTSVLPVVAPEVKVSAEDAAVTVKAAPTATIVSEIAGAVLVTKYASPE